MDVDKEGDETAFDVYNNSLGNTSSSMCAETSYDIMRGQLDAHIDRILAARVASSPLGSLPWTHADAKMDGLRELERSLCVHKSCVGTAPSDHGPPAAGKRELQRMNSEAKAEDERTVQEKERAQTWARAQSERRKYVKVVFFAPGKLEKTIETYMAKEETVATGSEHRMAHFAADSWWAAERQPWRAPYCSADEIKPLVETMLAKKQATDVILVHDGRSRTVRRMLADVFHDKAKHFADLWITYKPGACKGRNVFLGADNRETMFCDLPTSRTLWAVEEISDFTGAGEVDTHASTMAGVKPFDMMEHAFDQRVR